MQYIGRVSPDDSPAEKAVREAFAWLQNRDFIAPANQPGFYFVTTKGREIGTADNLKSYLAQQKSSADAAYATTLRDLADMKKEAASDIKDAVENAKTEAESILSFARATAEGVSLDDVQEQFSDAATACLTGIKIWASLSIGFILAFIITLVSLLIWWEPQTGANSALVIYHTVLRVTILTAIAALATFCLKILRAQLHLREQNLHRKRVANSMAAFLGASSPEQRDVILGRMVDTITAFGNSGLLSDSDESMSPAKVILESIPRAFSQKT